MGGGSARTSLSLRSRVASTNRFESLSWPESSITVGKGLRMRWYTVFDGGCRAIRIWNLQVLWKCVAVIRSDQKNNQKSEWLSRLVQLIGEMARTFVVCRQRRLSDLRHQILQRRLWWGQRPSPSSSSRADSWGLMKKAAPRAGAGLRGPREGIPVHPPRPSRSRGHRL